MRSLTSTSRVRITVSTWPAAGTTATSLPHSTSVLSASALTFTLTPPVCTRSALLCRAAPSSIAAAALNAVTGERVCACAEAVSPIHHSPRSSVPALLCFSFPPPPCFPISFGLIKPHLLSDYAASPHHCPPIHTPHPPQPPSPPPPPLILPFTAHNPSHRGQVQISPRGRGF